MTATEKIKESLLHYWEVFLSLVPNILFGLFILILAFLISRWISGWLQRKFASREPESLIANFVAKILRFFLVLIGFLLAFHVMGLTGIAGGLLAGAGVGALIIGLAFQEIGANFLAGIILAFNRPFNIGDTIEIDGNMGKVLALNLRNTHIKTFDGKDIYIPNNNIVKNEVTNYTRDGFIRLGFMIGIDYNDDVELVKEVILSAIKKIEPVLYLKGRQPFVVIKELASSSINIDVRFWLNTLDYRQNTLEVRSEVISQVLKDLAAAGIGLPSDIVELKHYKGQGFPIRMVDSQQSDLPKNKSQ